MSDLLDVDRLGEGSLLCVESLEVYTRLVVGDAIGGRRGVVADSRLSFLYADPSYNTSCLPHLLANQLSGASVILPGAKKQLSEEGVERLLLVAILFASAGVLLLQSRQEPLEH